MRRVKRTQDFEFSLTLTSEDFIAPPREAQRNWLVNRALSEFAADLVQLDRSAKRFVPGSEGVELGDRSQAELDEQEIMEDWQLPIMKAMAQAVAGGHGDVLEVGFGRGVSADYIQKIGVRSHTLVECNDHIARHFEEWRRSYPDRDIRLIHARWQDAAEELGEYDGIFFHTYPLDEDEFVENIINSVTFAEHFFPTAAGALRDGGALTYMTNEIDSLGREHQRAVLRHFRSFAVHVVRDLDLPHDLKDAWWADSMVVIRAVK